MSTAETMESAEAEQLPDLIAKLKGASEAAATLCKKATESLAKSLAPNGKVDGAALEREEHAAHGLAWVTTYAEAIREAANYAERMNGEGRFGEMEALLTQVASPSIWPSSPAAW
ncbi:hypothetical protein A7A08_02965 [Methyloligella halotolerans]|uniref:Uncharacterized protein n=1 Tax=Methyloligella halotolerans TaxID=1177755 RepID=A0A1E2RVD4_9HYPH|nr:hypothetical protein A7A08_02965 [Methyloligella halotolerans]